MKTIAQNNIKSQSIANKSPVDVCITYRVIVTIMVLWLMCCVIPITAAATTNTDNENLSPDTSATTAPPQFEYTLAPVIIDGRILFKVRGVSAYPAQKRAAEIAARIEQLAADESVTPDSIRLEHIDDRIAILSGNTRITYVFKEDAEVDNISEQLFAEAVVAKIKEAIVLYRSDRSTPHLTRSGLYALGATLLLILVVYLTQRFFGWLRRVLERRFKTKVDTSKIKTLKLVKTEQLWSALSVFITAIKVLLWVVSFYLYTNLVMRFFPWTRGLAENLLSVFVDPLRIIGGGIINALPNVVFLIILFFVARYILKIIRLLFASLAVGSMKITGFDREWSLPTYRLIRLFVIILALVVAYPYIPGSSSEAFKAISIFMGVIFSLGSSSLISNIVAGHSMAYRRAFKVGDRIKVGDILGDVTDIRLLVTHLRTIKNEEIIIPNSTILNSNIINYSSLAKQEGLILHTTVGIGYEVPWRQVHAMLLMAAERTENLLQQPQPFVLQKCLGDFCVTYELNAYCADAKDSPQLYDHLHQNILDVFNEYEVQIMTPAYERDTSEPKIVPKEQWYAAPAKPLNTPDSEK